MLTEDVAERLRQAWAQRQFGPFYERPLLLLSSLRFEALSAGPDHPLWAGIGASEPNLGAITEQSVRAALGADQRRLWRSLASRHVQTNETSRAIAWLWPAGLASESDPERPLMIYDIGASAGLNLVADRLPRIWQRSDGEPVELSPGPIVDRRGFDLRPLDVRDPEDARWLLACVWPGQRDRIERLESAIAAYREHAEADPELRVEALSADQVPERLPAPLAGEPRTLAYATIMRDYLPAEVRNRYEEGMRRWLERSAPGSAIWAELELTESEREGPPVDLTVHVATAAGPTPLVLARCMPHPGVLEPGADAVANLRQALA